MEVNAWYESPDGKVTPVKVTHLEEMVVRIPGKPGYDWKVTIRENGITNVTIGHTWTRWGARRAMAEAERLS